MFRNRFWVTLVLTVPVLVYSEHVRGWVGLADSAPPGGDAVPVVLGAIIFFYGGWPFLTGAVDEARARRPGMMMLIAMAITVAFVASLAGAFGLIDVEVWWELSLLIVVMLLGHWLEMRAIGQARGALAALAELLPEDAERVTDGGAVESVPVAHLAVGDLVLVRPGGRVPADGTVESGAAEVDESMVTGESRPVARGVGARVVAGTVATDSALRVRVEAVGDDTALAGIHRMVAEAQESRSRTQALADRAAAALFYVALAAGVITFTAWMIAGDPDSAVVLSATVLIIACPHALGSRSPWWCRSPPPSPPATASWSRTAWRWSACAPSTWCCSTRPARSPPVRTASPTSPRQTATPMPCWPWPPPWRARVSIRWPAP